MSIKGMQASLKGVQFLQGVHLGQVHPLSMHFYLVGELETSAPPKRG